MLARRVRSVRFTYEEYKAGDGSAPAARRQASLHLPYLHHRQYRRSSTVKARSSVASVRCGPARKRYSEKGLTSVPREATPPHITMKILPLFVLLVCVAWEVCGQDDETRPASRALLKRGPPTRGKPTTTTTTAAPQEEAEYEDEAEYAEEGQQEPSTEAPPSSTEGKKLVGSGVRPFRSNTDLLETLKRKRAEAAEAKLRAHSNSDTPAPAESPVEPAKSSYSKKRFNNSPAKEESSEESSAPKQSNRGRFGKRPATRSVQPEAEEESPAPSPVRNGRTFARRGN